MLHLEHLLATNYLEIEQEKQRAVAGFCFRTAKRPGKMGKINMRLGSQHLWHTVCLQFSNTAAGGSSQFVRGLGLEGQVLSESTSACYNSQLQWLNAMERGMYQKWVLGRAP